MQILEKVFKKKIKRIVGLMSGTSADGIDAVVVEVTGNGIHTKLKQLAFATYPYPKGFKEFLLKNSDRATARLDEVARLNVLVAGLFADAAKKIVRKAGFRLKEIDLIGSHGQTIQHLPEFQKMFGKIFRSTLQVGSPAIIAKLTGVATVGDFRIGDVAVGGSGAPLVPYFDYVMFRSPKINRALLNIGGIANITVLPKTCNLQDVFAFDTGPGNMLIDTLIQKFFGKFYDDCGDIASQGEIIPSLLHWMMKHPYLKRRLPKSTGREVFGNDFVQQILHRTRGQRKEDIVATVSEFTALSIYDNYLKFIRRKTKFDELLVSGGGVHNRYIMNALRRYFSSVRVAPIENLGFSSDAKEAICFAVLANETIAGNPTNVTRVTGARKPTVLGTICLP